MVMPRLAASVFDLLHAPKLSFAARRAMALLVGHDETRAVDFAGAGDEDPAVPPLGGRAPLVGTAQPALNAPALVQSLRLPLRPRLEILLGTARALAYLHGCGVVHLDVKSMNLMVTHR